VPCREEIPGLVELQKQYGDKGVVVVGLSLDQGGPELVKRFVERFKINYPVVMADEKIVKEFGSVEAVPTTFIIDREGRIAGKHIGFAEKAVFEREIKSLL
jgi:peroxiredoxin